MARAIVITDCTQCPHKDHQGEFALVACIPVCRRANKELPHSVHPAYHGKGYAASYTGVIPEWCPLPIIQD